MEDNKLDEIDFKILRILQRDVRIPFKEIADQCKVSPDTVKKRYNKMKKTKVILGNTIVIDPKKMGQGNLVIIGIQVIQQFTNRSI